MLFRNGQEVNATGQDASMEGYGNHLRRGSCDHRYSTGVRKKSQTDLTFFCCEDHCCGHCGGANGRAFLEPELSAGNGSYDTPETGCQKGSWMQRQVGASVAA